LTWAQGPYRFAALTNIWSQCPLSLWFLLVGRSQEQQSSSFYPNRNASRIEDNEWGTNGGKLTGQAMTRPTKTKCTKYEDFST
jgi:hypothetical protein